MFTMWILLPFLEPELEEVRNAWAADTALERRPQHVVLSGGHNNDVLNG